MIKLCTFDQIPAACGRLSRPSISWSDRIRLPGEPASVARLSPTRDLPLIPGRLDTNRCKSNRASGVETSVFRLFGY